MRRSIRCAIMHNRIHFFALLGITLTATVYSKPIVKEVHYALDGVEFVSTLVWDSGLENPAPGILMVPNWMGPSEGSLEKAMHVAGEDYVVMMVDMYGKGIRPSNGKEAGEAAGVLRNDRDLMRTRAAKALEVMLEQGAEGVAPVDGAKMAAIGFCFGGGTVLELGRSGADIDAVVSFHGDLISPTLEEDASKMKARVLVLHGAKDPYVPQEDVQKWIAVMNDTDVDWTLVQLSGAVHSFTNPEANSSGSKYHPVVSARAFEMMRELFDQIWAK